MSVDVTLTEQGSVYISFGPKPDIGYVLMPDPEHLGITVHFDFDSADGRLAGMEIQDAESVLPLEFLERSANRSAKPSY